MSIMATTNLRPITETQKIKTKESKCNATENHQIREESKKGRKEPRGNTRKARKQ